MEKRTPATITAVASYLPPRKVTNAELSQTLDTSDEWIRSHTGIASRYLAAEEVGSSDLAVEALKKLFLNREEMISQVDAIIVATATGDYNGFPSTACLIQEKFNLPKVAAFDLAAGCTGFVYALEVARTFLATPAYNSVLVIGTEKLSTVTNFKDRKTAILFGDGAGALLMSRGGEGVILDSLLYADGSGAPSLAISPTNNTIEMDGRYVYNFAIRVIGEVVTQLLEQNNLTLDQVDWIVPHQANNRIIEAAAKRLNINLDKFFMNIEEYGNTSAASIPIALDEMVKQGLLKRGQLVITLGFGAGLTYGGNLIKW